MWPTKVIPSVTAWGETYKNVVVRIEEYADKSGPAIQLWTEFGEPLATATINLSRYGIVPDPNCVILRATKDGGVAYILLDAGIVGLTGRKFEYGPFDSYAFEAQLFVQKEN